MILAPMIRVLARREEKKRLQIASLARDISATQDKTATVAATIAAVERRARENAHARFAAGPRSIASLLELEQNSQSLRTGLAELETLRQRTAQSLAALVEQRRTLAREWRREDSRLAHASERLKRERMRIDARQLDADDDEHLELRAARAQPPRRADRS
jgi:chromosome segregation ATPase